MFSSTNKYKGAPHNKYCGATTCTSDSSKAGCALSGDRKGRPDGYKYQDYCHDCPSVACTWGTGLSKYERDPNDTYWNPLPERINISTASASDIEKAYNCCNNNVISTADKDDCGLFYTGTDTQSADCRAVMNRWCMKDDNILEPKCKALINSNPAFKTHLETKCKGKRADDTKWGEVCPCFLDYPFYDKLANAVSEKWIGPEHAISRVPECIYPKCFASRYHTNEEPNCGSVSFASCVINNNLDLVDADVQNVNIKQECNFLPKNNTNKPNNNPNNNPNNPPTDTPTDKEAQEKKKKEDEEKKKKEKQTQLMIMIFIFIVVCVSGYIFINRQGSNDYDDDDDDDYDDDE